MTSTPAVPGEGGALFKVLQIEDDTQYAYLVREHLHLTRPDTFSVERTARLSTGLDLLARGGVDLVLLDLDLPDSRGLDTFLALRGSYPGVPVVILTGHDDEEMAVEALLCGAQDYLVKARTDQLALGRSLLYAVQRHLATDRTTLLLQEVQDGESRLDDVLEGSADGILILDRFSRAVFVNRAAEQIFARPRSGLMGEKLDFLMTDGESGEVDIVRPGVAALTADIRVMDTRWQGEPAQMVWLRDVSEHNQMEDIRARLEEEEAYSSQLKQVGQHRSEMLHTVTDRLTAPLALLRNAVDLFDQARLGKPTPQQRQVVELMSRNLRRLERYAADALQLSRLDSGARALPVRDMDLEWALRPVLEMLGQRAAQREMVIQLGDPTGLRVHACPDAVADVVGGLVNHAILRNAPGTTIRVAFARPVAGEIEVTVADDGEGMDPATLSRLFDVPTAPGPSDEHGLAMAVCHSLVERMGGSLEAESPRGGGTSVRFSLPVTPLPPPTVFGRVARDMGFVSDGDIATICNAPIGRARERKRIGDLLVQHGMLSDAQRQATLSELSRRLSTPHPHVRGSTLRDGLLGRMVLGRGLITQRQLDEALRVQENRRDAGQHHLLGRVMVESNLLEMDQLAAVLSSQGVRVMQCVACSRRFNLLAAKGEAAAVCVQCGSATAPADETQILDVDGEILPGPPTA